MDKWYYLDKDNKINNTDSLEKLILLLYNNSASLLDEIRLKDLKLENDYIKHIKREISKNENRVPMYDASSNRIYLIYKKNIYNRIFEDDYRFVDEYFLNDLYKNQSDLDENDLENLRILKNYDMKTLKNTYMKIFYESFILTKYITSCLRPSSKSKMEHIKPYYGIDELFYLAYDWNLTDKPISDDEDEINKLCSQIVEYDISADILLKNQLHIYDNKAIGLVKHYSLFGSYFINKYLRKMNDKNFVRNPVIERQTNLMMNLIKTAPKFKKDYTVYRFIETDNHLKHLKIGDTYTDPSFISTTRNPFYYQENYMFGYILMKIKIPANIEGVGICIESYSNFPKEEEIVLPPTTKLKLNKITTEKNIDKYQNIMNKRVKKKYEFTLIDNNVSTPLDFDDLGPLPNIDILDLKNIMRDETIEHVSIVSRLKFFIDKYTNKNNQFISTINNKEHIFVVESYNSSNVYGKFFYYKTDSGIIIYSTNLSYGNINIILEIGPEIHVNYYFKESVSDPSDSSSNQTGLYGDKESKVNIKTPELIEWMSEFAYIIGSRKIIIHSEYVLGYNDKDDEKTKLNKTRYIYSQNIYDYLKHGIKYYGNVVEITPQFDYGLFDILEKTSVDEVVRITDRNELYKIYIESKINNLKDFYIYIVENNPKFLNILINNMDRIEQFTINPFLNIRYELDAWAYLYNKAIITTMPSENEFTIKKGSFKTIIGDKKIPQFKNRLRDYLENK